jgi:hypothetical protein
MGRFVGSVVDEEITYLSSKNTYSPHSATATLDLFPNNLMPAKCHIRLQAIFENLKIAMLFFGLLKRLSLESDIFRL